MKLAVLYAGQGAQHPGMGKEFYEDSPAFRAAFDSAELDFDLHRVCFEDPDGLLNQTEYTQPCMVAFACGVTAVLAQQGVKPAYVAGLSLGEYSALEAAGVFTAKQAIELAAYRGKAMAEAAKGIDCGMTAVLNLDRQALAAPTVRGHPLCWLMNSSPERFPKGMLSSALIRPLKKSAPAGPAITATGMTGNVSKKTPCGRFCRKSCRRT